MSERSGSLDCWAVLCAPNQWGEVPAQDRAQVRLIRTVTGVYLDMQLLVIRFVTLLSHEIAVNKCDTQRNTHNPTDMCPTPSEY